MSLQYGFHRTLTIEAGRWHSLEVLKVGTVIFEAKDGAYEPLNMNDLK